MAEFPAMPLWTDRLTAKCHHLSDAEYGLYIRIIVLMWQAPEQRLPYDAAWLGRKFSRSSAEVEATIFPLVAEFCTLISGGKFFTQKTVREQFDYLKTKREKQSIRSKARWDKEKDVSRGNAAPHNSGNAAIGNALSTPTPTPILEEKINPKSPAPVVAAIISIDPDKRLFDEGERILGPGKRGMIGKLLKLCSGDPVEALDQLRKCDGKANPVEYLGGILRNLTGMSFDERCRQAQIDAMYRKLI